MTEDNLLDHIKVDRRQVERYLFYFGRGKNGDAFKKNLITLTQGEMTKPGVSGPSKVSWHIRSIMNAFMPSMRYTPFTIHRK